MRQSVSSTGNIRRIPRSKITQILTIKRPENERSHGLTRLSLVGRRRSCRSGSSTDSHEGTKSARRSAGRQLQSGAWRAPSNFSFCQAGAGTFRGLVAGLSRQSAEIQQWYGAAQGPRAFRDRASKARSDPRHGDRARAGDAIHSRYAGGACPPVSENRVRVADGLGQSGTISPLEALAHYRATDAYRRHCEARP